jgi:predicted ATP-dependent Lon-type protease
VKVGANVPVFVLEFLLGKYCASSDVRDYERLRTGGIWAQIDMRFEYDEEGKGKNPFWIDKLTPIRVATFDLDEYQQLRGEFSADEWIEPRSSSPA